MHTNAYPGISRAAEASNFIDDCDTRCPWQEEEVVEGGGHSFEKGAFKPPDGPGLAEEPLTVKR
jgi:L-alanine-DL-glutamate epimerase-like enolase superfamily enzyme